MLSWVSITPLGVAVEPEVYCRTARVPPDGAGSFQVSGSEAEASSVRSQCRGCPPGACPRRRPAKASIMGVVRTAAARALATIA